MQLHLSRVTRTGAGRYRGSPWNGQTRVIPDGVEQAPPPRLHHEQRRSTNARVGWDRAPPAALDKAATGGRGAPVDPRTTARSRASPADWVAPSASIRCCSGSAFAILAFTGFGLLLYVLGWLLLPADGDEVSPGEALLGRGQSSTPPALAVGLGIAAIIFAGGIFSWGLPVVPLVIGGIIAVVVLRKRARMGSCAGRRDQMSSGFQQGQQFGGPQRRTAVQRTAVQRTAVGRRMVGQGQPEGGVLGRPGRAVGGPPALVRRMPGRHSRSPRKSAPASPFDKPAFWDEETATQRNSTAGTGRAGSTSARTPLPRRPNLRNRHRRPGIHWGWHRSPGICRSRRRSRRHRRPAGVAASSAGSPWAPSC